MCVCVHISHMSNFCVLVCACVDMPRVPERWAGAHLQHMICYSADFRESRHTYGCVYRCASPPGRHLCDLSASATVKRLR